MIFKHNFLRLSLFLVIISLSSVCTYSQVKIGNKTYLYGSKDVDLKNKILVKFIDIPTRTEVRIMKIMNQNYEAVNFLDLVLGNFNLSQEQLEKMVQENNFDQIIVFQEVDSRYMGVSSTNETQKSRQAWFEVVPQDTRIAKSKSSSASSEVLTMLELSMTLYDVKNEITTPKYFVKSKIDVSKLISGNSSNRALVGYDNRTEWTEKIILRIFKSITKFEKKKK